MKTRGHFRQRYIVRIVFIYVLVDLMQNQRLLVITTPHDGFELLKKLNQNTLQLFNIKGMINCFKKLQFGGAKFSYRLF
ncbi:hypothetical protein D3C76_590540 [compost metagenome]